LALYKSFTYLLTYVSALPDITQKPKLNTDELKQRLIDTWNHIRQRIRDKAIDQWQACLHACVKAKGRQCQTPTKI